MHKAHPRINLKELKKDKNLGKILANTYWAQVLYFSVYAWYTNKLYDLFNIIN